MKEKMLPPLSKQTRGLSLLNKAVFATFVAISGYAVASTSGGSDGILDLTNVTELTDSSYSGWPRKVFGEDAIDLTGGRITVTADKSVGKISNVNASFFVLDAEYSVNSNKSIAITDNKVNISSITNSSTKEVGGVLFANWSWMPTGLRSAIALRQNSGSVELFESVDFSSFVGADIAWLPGLGAKESSGTVDLYANNFTVTDSKELNLNATGNGHGVMGVYAHLLENSQTDWSSQSVDCVGNYVTINNSSISAVPSSGRAAWAWISGGSLYFYGDISNKAALNRSRVSVKDNFLFVKGGSSLSGQASLYGANVRFAAGADGRDISVANNYIHIFSDNSLKEKVLGATETRASVDVSGIIAGGMVDYFTTMKDTPSINLFGNRVEVENSEVASSVSSPNLDPNQYGVLTGSFAYGHNVYAKNQVVASSPNLNVAENYVGAENSELNSSVYGGIAISQGGGQNRMNEWEPRYSYDNHQDGNSSHGMNSGHVSANSNSVKISDSTSVKGDIYGSYAESTAMAGQFLTELVDILEKNVTFSGDVESSGNKVHISDSTVKGNLYGGYAWSHGTEAEDLNFSDHAVNAGNVTAFENELTICNSTIEGKVYGGYALSESLNGGAVGTMTADQNKITLIGGEENNLTGAHLYGSNLSAGATEGNTLTVDASAGAIGGVASLNNFDNLSFENLQWSTESTLVVNGGDLSSLESITIANVAVSGELPVDQAQMTVLENGSAEGLGLTDANVGEKRFVKLNNGSTALEKQALISVNDEGDVILTVGGKLAPTDQTALLAENRSVAVSFASLTNDLIPEVLESIDNNEEGLKTFALMEGSAVKFDVNTDLKINGWYGLFGAGSSWRGTDGTLLGAAFFELGRGNYRTDNTFNEERFSGDGNIDNYALGLATRYKWDSNLYVDAGAKVGWLSTDMDRALKNINGEFFDIDSDSYYWSLHLGLGKVFDVTDRSTLDLYGRYYFTYTSDESSQAGIDRYEADAITSHRVRLGARYGYQVSNSGRAYVGLGYDYEFDGDVDMHVSGVDLPTQSSQGSTGFGEIGLNWTFPNAPVDIDMRVKGYTGQWQGVSGMVKATYTFN